MDDLYGGAVFDEVALVKLAGNRGELLHYTGHRSSDFEAELQRDLHAIQKSLEECREEPGAFDFSFEGEGTAFDAFMTLGADIFLLCNRLDGTTKDITRNPRWLAAQEAFVDLSQRFAVNPVV